MPGVDDHDASALDRALDRLRAPTTVHDRLDVLRQLVDFWHDPIRPEDGMSDAEIGGMALPLPLRWWYRWAGKRNDVLSGQNVLFVPRDYRNKYRVLAVRDGRLRFYVENQGVYEWATLPNGDDPPVFGRYDLRGRWVQEQVTLSEHLILMCLFEAVMGRNNYGASKAWLDEKRLEVIVRHIPALAIRPWRWMGARFFAHSGAFMCAAENGTSDGAKWFSVWIAAKTAQPLQFLKPLLDDTWEHIAV
jgi:hypothetical protein